MGNKLNTINNSGVLQAGRSQYLGNVTDNAIIATYNNLNFFATGDTIETTITETLTPETAVIYGAPERNYIKKIHLPPQIKAVESGAMAGMENAEEVDVRGVEYFGEESMAGVAQAKPTIDIRLEKAKDIMPGAFLSANANIYLNKDVESVGENAFFEAEHLYYSGSLEGAPWGANNWN